VYPMQKAMAVPTRNFTGPLCPEWGSRASLPVNRVPTG
jgi:hypothetical protein